MNRRDFESLRALPGKTISGPIRLSQKQATHPLLTADRIPIENDQGIAVWMNINYNPETGPQSQQCCRLGREAKPSTNRGRERAMNREQWSSPEDRRI